VEQVEQTAPAFVANASSGGSFASASTDETDRARLRREYRHPKPKEPRTDERGIWVITADELLHSLPSPLLSTLPVPAKFS
jgi:hypothetical protein